ncbi:hypothetical protein H4582DRAFT_2110489 [Lactarius indigo]|nr:hypothetical protein H4582DRAFT_2110489 [Lactarius indigo]
MEDAPKAKTVSTLPTLDQAHFEELSASIRGDVFRRGDQRFHEHTRLIILFCNKHELSPSVKAGGYGTGGWAINGDIVIDLSRIQDMDIEPPQPCGGGYTSLRDTIQSADKGKARVGDPVLDLSGPATRKRVFEAEAEHAPSSSIPPSAWVNSTASAAVASFLHGPALPPDDSDEEPRRPATNRRRLDIDGSALTVFTNSLVAETLTARSDPFSSSSGSGTHSSGRSPGSGTSPSTHATTPASRSPHSDSALSSAPPAPFTFIEPFDMAPSRPDPFAYIDNIDPPTFGPSPPTPLASSAAAWGSDAALLAHPLFAGDDFPSHLARPAPPHTHAYVSFGAGARQKDVDLFTSAHPLDGGVVPYHSPIVLGASVMLLGGFGFLSRLHGLSIDNLVEAEVVLADGRIVIVNEKEHQDLWWGLRGSAYPVPVVFAGNLIYRFHRATAPSLLRHFRDCIKGAPRELYANVLLTAGPADKDSLVVIQMCYIGPKEQGLEYLNALSSWSGERCLLNEVHEKTRGNQWFIRSALISSLPDEVINKTVLEFADTPVGCTWLFELAGGAITDYEDTCIPKAQREAKFTIAALHQWEMGVDDPRCVSSAEDWLRDTIKPVAAGGSFPSFLGRGEPPARVAASFGESWERLVALKKE